MAICAGYSALLSALGEAAGTRVDVVGGTTDRGERHAWNRVCVDGRPWYIDVTWDSGYLDDLFVFHKHYSTRYFMVEEDRLTGHTLDEDFAHELVPSPARAHSRACRWAHLLDADARLAGWCATRWRAPCQS